MDNDNRDSSIEEHKHLLRVVLRRQLGALAASTRRAWSEVLVSRLAELPEWKNACRVALFAPMPTEPDIDGLWLGGHLDGKVCYYPAVCGPDLVLYQLDQLDKLRPMPPWNLREPARELSRAVSLAEIDLILVPGLAFDERGGRLGRGGGFYDRLLAARRPQQTIAIGVGFAFQRLDSVPRAPHDALLDAVVFS